MRVLLLTGMYPHTRLSSAGIAIARQRRSLQEQGIEVDLLHCRPEGKWQWRTALRQLRAATASGRYDLVHAHSGFRTNLLAALQPLPFVMTYHGSDVNGYPFLGWRTLPYSMLTSAAAGVTRQLSRGAAAVIVMTAEMKQRLPMSVQRKTHVLPMGIDTELFHPHDRAMARAELGWGKGPVAVFCTLGSKGVKRPDLAQAAVRVAQRQQPDLTLFFLHGIAPDRVPLVLSAADCLLVTSEREGSPNVVREGFACNLPVVSVPVGDVADLLQRHPEAGALAPRDPVALGKAIVEVLRRPRPDLRPILRECSLEATARRVIAIYQQVLGERAQEAPTGCDKPGSCVCQPEALARGAPR